MSQTTPTMPERLDTLQAALFSFAMAVHAMRRAQRDYEDDPNLITGAEKDKAEAEVDALVEKELTPRPM